MFQIPELKVAIPVYQRNGESAQKIIDRDNSACIFPFGVGRMIGDHYMSESNNGKGRWDIGRVNVDDAAFLVTKDKTEAYQCTMVAVVDVQKYGYTFEGKGMAPHLATDLICTSCTDEGSRKNYWALFKYKGLMP